MVGLSGVQSICQGVQMNGKTLQVRIDVMAREAEDIVSLVLRPAEGGILPPFRTGAHIDLHLPNGLRRSYSLLNDEGDRECYVIAVQKDRNSRGGSAYIHDSLKVGDRLSIGAPRNDFPLVEDAAHIVLIAGGIGVTPLFAMARRLAILGKSWEFHYCARSRRSAAFLDEIVALCAANGRRFHGRFDDESDGKFIDLDTVVAAAPAGAHFYCCGPAPMLAAFGSATAAVARDRVHVEYFTAKEVPDVSGGFVVELARSGRRFDIPAGKTILEVLIENRMTPKFQCMEGVCGECESRVLAGTPIHRDSYLTEEERASNKTMMICCSGCLGDKLVLDI